DSVETDNKKASNPSFKTSSREKGNVNCKTMRFYREEVEPNEGHGGSQKRARERQVLIRQVQEARHAAHKRKKRAVRRYPQGNHGALSNRTRDLLFRSYFHLLNHRREPRRGGDRRSLRDRKAASGAERCESFGPEFRDKDGPYDG